jgi:epsin
MEALEEQLKDMSNWRQMSKALQIIEYCIQEGAERCAAWAVRRAQFLGSLRGSVILDKDGNDVGSRGKLDRSLITKYG